MKVNISNLLINKLKSGLFKRTLIYGFSSFLAASVNFLLLPVFTRYLSQYDYGIIATFTAVQACLTGIIGLGSSILLTRKYFGLELEEKKAYIGNILVLILINSMFALLMVLLFSDFFSNLIKLDKMLLLLVAAISSVNIVGTILLTLFQLEKKAVKYAIFLNSKTLTNIGISLFLVLWIGLKWQGRIAGISSSSLLFFIVTILIFKCRNIRLGFSKKYFKELILLGLPLVVCNISGWANNMIDRLMINNLINIESTGLYDVGYRFGMIIMMVETAFSRSWLPFFYEKIESGNFVDKLKIVRVTYIYSALLVVFALFFGFFGKYILYFMVDKKFYAAGQFVFLIAIGYCFDGIRKLFSGYLIHKGRTGFFSLITFLSAAINVVLNFVLLKKIGLMGAAWATFFSFMAGFAMMVIAASEFYRMPWLSKEVFFSKSPSTGDDLSK